MAGTIDEMIKQYEPLWTTEIATHRLVEVEDAGEVIGYLVCDLAGGSYLIEDDDVHEYVVNQMLAAGVEVLTAAAMRELWIELGVDHTS
jgi:hypothetical protein